MLRRAVVALLTVAVSAAVATPAAASPGFDPQSVRTPAMCRHAATRLHDGAVEFGTDAQGASKGGASLVPRHFTTKRPVPDPIVALQHGTSAHGAVAALPIDCDAGGVGWPQTIVLYRASGTVLASRDLGSFGQQEHADVTAIHLRGDHLRVHWTAYDGAGFDRHHWAATFTLQGSRLIASHVTR